MAGVSNIVQGKNCIFRVNIGSGFATFACTKGFTLVLDTETKETTSRGSGIFREYDYKSIGWRLSFQSIIKVEDEDLDPVAFDITSYQLNFLELPIQGVFQDNQSKTKQFAGICIVQNSTLAAMAGQLADGSFELLGSGAIEIASVSGDACDNSITQASVNGFAINSGEAVIITAAANLTLGVNTLSNMIVTVSRFDYEIDSSGRNSHFTDGSLPATFPTILSSAITTGSHVVKIWPICDNGFDGPQFTINLTKMSPD